MTTDTHPLDLAGSAASDRLSAVMREALDLAAAINRRLGGRASQVRITPAGHPTIHCRLLDGEACATLAPADA